MKLHRIAANSIADWQFVVRQMSWVLGEMVIMLITLDGEDTAKSTCISGRHKKYKVGG